MSGKKRAADEIVTIFKGSKKKPKSHKKPRAKWSKEETSLLVDKLNEGERVSDLLHFFPKKRKQQVHSKVSNLKQKKLVSVQRESIAPSLHKCDELLGDLLSGNARESSESDAEPKSIESASRNSSDQESEIRDFAEEPQKKISGGTPIMIEVPDDNMSEGPKDTDVFKGNPYLASPFKKQNKAISPLKSSGLKLPKINDRCPLIYWTFDYNDHWYVIVKEDDLCSFALKEEAGVTVNWEVSAQDIHLALGLPLTKTYEMVRSLSGSHSIPSFHPLGTNSCLVEKLSNAQFRIIKIPWKGIGNEEF